MTSTSPPDSERIRTAYEKVCRVLLDRKTPEGHWNGRLSDSALSTATAVSALSVHGADEHRTLIRCGIDWLIDHQNSDGGWGDTDKSVSNISTTLLVKSALHLA
ncbi:MAG: squalene--hopene cyclase, partial [Planctomycetaceae bacterium]|nr:squalene--hopene cyclase [Planctomycetaceae bacterium]